MLKAKSETRKCALNYLHSAQTKEIKSDITNKRALFHKVINKLRKALKHTN